MKKAQEILEMVEGRLSSPLIFSFLISWFITNWEITLIILFGVDSAPLIEGENQTLIEAIQSRLSLGNSFCWPFFWALLYTFVNPWIQGKIRNFYTRIKRNTENKDFAIMEEKGLIKAQKYIDTKNELYEQYEKIQKITEEEQAKQTKFLQLQRENQKNEEAVNILNQQLSKQNEEIRILERVSSPKFMEGSWNISLKDNDDDLVSDSLQIVVFDNGTMNYINNTGSQDGVGRLEYVFFDRNQKLLSFILIIHSDSNDAVKTVKEYFGQNVILFELKQLSNVNCFEGTQNKRSNVQWSRTIA